MADFAPERIAAMQKAIAATEGGADTLRALLNADLHDAGMAGDVPAQLQFQELLRLLAVAEVNR